MIHQELSPVPELPVAQNIFLGREPKKFGFVDYRALYQQTEELFLRLHIDHIHPKVRMGDLKIADQQLVEIAKAISLNARILVMDEPTSAITDRELVSGLGTTPVMELYVLYSEIEKRLIEKGIRVHRAYMGNYFSSLEMMGATLSLMKLDDELKELIDMDCYSMGLRQHDLNRREGGTK